MSNWTAGIRPQQSGSQGLKIGRTPAQLFSNGPVAFMENNYVDPGTVAPRGFIDAQTPVRIQFAKGYAVAKSTVSNKLIPSWGIGSSISNGPESLLVYWCPYEDSKFSMGWAGTQADFMFTAMMDGCSFGIGSPTQDGSRVVCHANMKYQTNTRQKQNAILRGMGLAKKLVNPDVYMGLVTGSECEAKVTTFGVRNPQTGDWRFYYQLSKKSGGGGHGGGFVTNILGVIPV